LRRPFELERIDHILLLVRGMDRALAFYEGVLGAAVESRLPRYAMVELIAGASRIDLVDVDEPHGAWARPPLPGGRNVDHFAVRLSSCDEASLRSHLQAHGVTVVEERRESQGVSLYVRDPAGNTIELIAPRG